MRLTRPLGGAVVLVLLLTACCPGRTLRAVECPPPPLATAPQVDQGPHPEAVIAQPDGVVDQAWIERFLRARHRIGSEGLIGIGDEHGPRWDTFLTDADRREITELLVEALPVKRGRARQEALGALTWLDGGDTIRHGGALAFRAAAVGWWHDLEPDFRAFLLREHWQVLRDPALVPLLRAEIEAARPSDSWSVEELGSLALLRYTDLEPDDGRRRILTDIRSDPPRFGSVALASLPDEHLDEVDELFRATPDVIRRRPGFWKQAALAERYGGPSILPKVVALLEERRWACEVAEYLLGYVLKHDRPQGLRLVERAARTRGPNETGCYRLVLGVLKKYWGPDARALVESFRDDPDVDVRRTVERLLEG